ncbi:MAG: cell wall hydrolase [Alphaproteobacteria bacterium]
MTIRIIRAKTVRALMPVVAVFTLATSVALSTAQSANRPDPLIQPRLAGPVDVRLTAVGVVAARPGVVEMPAKPISAVRSFHAQQIQMIPGPVDIRLTAVPHKQVKRRLAVSRTGRQISIAMLVRTASVFTERAVSEISLRAKAMAATGSQILAMARGPESGGLERPQRTSPLPGPADLRLTDLGLVMAIRSTPLFTDKDIDATGRGPNFAQGSLKCLATAVYFESRGEPVAGQYAVAHVIANRVRNRFYPATICGVVYQNWYRRNRCQFSFACDGNADIAKNVRAWERSVAVARTVLTSGSGPVATPIRRSTHFHATYVRPYWSRKLQQTGALGQHIFYVTYRQ